MNVCTGAAKAGLLLWIIPLTCRPCAERKAQRSWAAAPAAAHRGILAKPLENTVGLRSAQGDCQGRGRTANGYCGTTVGTRKTLKISKTRNWDGFGWMGSYVLPYVLPYVLNILYK